MNRKSGSPQSSICTETAWPFFASDVTGQKPNAQRLIMDCASLSFTFLISSVTASLSCGKSCLCKLPEHISHHSSPQDGVDASTLQAPARSPPQSFPCISRLPNRPAIRRGSFLGERFTCTSSHALLSQEALLTTQPTLIQL